MRSEIRDRAVAGRRDLADRAGQVGRRDTRRSTSRRPPVRRRPPGTVTAMSDGRSNRIGVSWQIPVPGQVTRLSGIGPELTGSTGAQSVHGSSRTIRGPEPPGTDAPRTGTLHEPGDDEVDRLWRRRWTARPSVSAEPGGGRGRAADDGRRRRGDRDAGATAAALGPAATVGSEPDPRLQDGEPDEGHDDEGDELRQRRSGPSYRRDRLLEDDRHQLAAAMTRPSASSVAWRRARRTSAPGTWSRAW